MVIMALFDIRVFMRSVFLVDFYGKASEKCCSKAETGAVEEYAT